MSSPVRVEILGPLRLLRDGSPVPLRAPQQRRALATLAAAGAEGVAIDRLEELLWPGGAPSVNALQAVVSKLRRLLDPVDIVLDTGRYRLVGPYTTDLEELERRHDALDDAGIERLVRGEPLEELDGDPVAITVRRRVAAVLSAARHRRLDAAVRGDRPESVLAELEAQTVSDPLDERWWCLLMVGHYRAGNQVAALDAYQRARQILAEELGLEPGPELRELERMILVQAESLAPASSAISRAAPPATGASHVGRLPARMASFVGRRHELAELAELLHHHRLVSLLGPGGVGKTTTALELARTAESAGFVENAGFVELAAEADHESIVRAFARAIGLPDVEQAAPGTVGSDPLDRVVDALSATQALLVVDNCEHVVAEAAAVIHRFLRDCPDLTIVATSREALAVPGEFAYPLPPLPNEDAVELFVERAQARAAGAAVSVAPGERLAELCERLDGLPLAIELAAARLRTASVDELLDRLDDRFGLLANGPRTLEPRQQTLRAVVDWSHDLLEPAERAVFRRLAAFVGGASPAAARFVCSGPSDGDDIAPDAVDEIVHRLVDKSLVVVDHHADGVRWRMLETLHAYANERLLQSGERERVLVRHAQHFADFLVPAPRGLVGRDQQSWFTRIGRERRNLEAALETALARADAQLALELTMPLGWYFYMVGEIDAGAGALGEALACSGPTDPEIRAGALGLLGWLLANTPDLERATATTDEAMSMLDRIRDPWIRGMVANTHVMALFFAGHVDRVTSQMELVREIVGDVDDPWIRAMTDLVEAELLQHLGATSEAERSFLAAADAFERGGDGFGYALAIAEASEVAEMRGDYDRAAALLRHGLAIADEIGFSGHPLGMRARLGNIEILRGDLDLAESIHQGLLVDPGARAAQWIQGMAQIGLASVARRRDELDVAEEWLRGVWALGRTHTVPHMRLIAAVARGYLADQRGDAVAALEHQRVGLQTAERLRTPRGLAYSLEGVAGALAISGCPCRHDLGARLLGAADRLRRESGGPMPEAERFDVDRAERRLRAELGDARFAAGFAAGGTCAVDALVAEVMALDVGDSEPGRR